MQAVLMQMQEGVDLQATAPQIHHQPYNVTKQDALLLFS